MAGSAVIGALRVVLGADTAAFEDGLKNASGKLDSFGSSASSKLDSFASGVVKSAAAVGVAMVGAATALGFAIQHSVEKIDNLGKAAQKAGAPVEEFSALASSAGKVKISVDELANGMEKLAKNMSAIAGGGKTTDAGRAFQALGISVKDAEGNLKSSSSVISELAGKFENFQDSPAKTALAIAIFGKAGAEMIPLLNQGSAALKKQRDEMEELGLVIDQKTFKSAEAFNQSLARLGKVKDSIIMKITVGMLPAMEDMSAAFVKSSKDAQAWADIGSIVGGTLKVLTSVVQGFSTWMRQTALDIEAVSTAAKLIGGGEFSKAIDVFKRWREESKKLNEESSQIIGDMWTKPAADAINYAEILDVVAANLAAVANVKLAAPTLANTAAIDKFVDSTKKSIAAQDAETQTIGMAAGAKEKLRVVLQGLEVATANHIPITDALRARLDALGLSAEQSALKLAGQQLAFANKEPLVLYQTELANTQTAMMAVGATADQLARNQENVAQRFGMSWQNIGANIAATGGALSQLTGTFAKENKAMGIASKAFGIAQAVINTQIAITKALATLPPPASYVAVGLAIAQGAASIAAISAQSFAKGGSFMVPGGKSMTDNIMVPLNLASGERVDITPANDVGSRGGRGGNTVIELHGEKFSRDQVRDLFETINSGLADGHKFKVA